MINQAIAALVAYGISSGLTDPEDRVYVRNRLLAVLRLEDYTGESALEASLPDILKILVDDAAGRGLLDGTSSTERDLFDTALMDALMPPPSVVRKRFQELYAQSPKAATDAYYQLSRRSNYIRTDRVAKDRRWQTSTKFGVLDLSINLSKPEKDPKAIAAARLAKPSSYPSCLLCADNEGYAGRMNHPARQNHRLIPVSICGQPWYLQYSPYVYYNEHCILLNRDHVPMKIDRAVFEKLLCFVSQFPHYFIGSNADLPIVGGSILSHEHFQGGCYTFPMERAPLVKTIRFAGFEDVEAGIVRWYLSCIRLRHQDPEQLIDLADHILACWRQYTDGDAMIFAETEGEPHNTITPIARMRDGKFELDLVLRNNLTTEEHPLGLYHPHEELHHIKKENIGLIEVMGLAVLPARLKHELEVLRDRLIAGQSLTDCQETAAHAAWASEFAMRCLGRPAEEVDRVLQYEVGQTFAQVLEHAGVFRQDEAGLAAFFRFLAQCGAY